MSARMPELPNAACREPEAAPLFKGRQGNNAVKAKQVCARCWDRPECLTWGLEHEDSGIWGGYGLDGLRRLRQQFGITLHPIYSTGISDATTGWRQ